MEQWKRREKIHGILLAMGERMKSVKPESGT